MSMKCTECNTDIILTTQDRKFVISEKIEGIPLFRKILIKDAEFYICPNCGEIFLTTKQAKKIEKRLIEIVKNNKTCSL